MILQKPKVELGAHIEGQPLRASFFPHSIMSQELKASIEEVEKVRKLKDADDHKINRIYSPRLCLDHPKPEKIHRNSANDFNLDLQTLNKSSAYNLKS